MRVKQEYILCEYPYNLRPTLSCYLVKHSSGNIAWGIQDQRRKRSESNRLPFHLRDAVFRYIIILRFRPSGKLGDEPNLR